MFAFLKDFSKGSGFLSDFALGLIQGESDSTPLKVISSINQTQAIKEPSLPINPNTVSTSVESQLEESLESMETFEPFVEEEQAA